MSRSSGLSKTFKLLKPVFICKALRALGSLSLMVSWSMRPLTTHDLTFNSRFLAVSQMARGVPRPVIFFSWLRKSSLGLPLGFFPGTFPARQSSSSSPFLMTCPVKLTYLAWMILRSLRSWPTLWSSRISAI